MTSPRASTVLVVEDDFDLREAVADTLLDAGYEVVTAANGQEALARLRAGGPQPELILLDLMMPVMDGWRFREEQLKVPELARIPVVTLSAHADATGLAAAAHLHKPVQPERLLDEVARFCRPRD